MKKNKKPLVIIVCIALIAAICGGIYYIATTSKKDNSPQAAVVEYLTAYTSGNTKKAMQYSAMDYESYFKDEYSDENVMLLIQNNDNGIADKISTPAQFYYSLSQSYQVNINNGKDYYNAIISGIDGKADVASITAVSTNTLDLNDEATQEAIGFYKKYNFTGLNSNDYFNPDSVSEACEVEVSIKYTNGDEANHTLLAFKIDGKWCVMVDLAALV